MKITDALLGEHGLFVPLFEALEQVVEQRPPASIVVAALEPIASAIVSHASVEDELLFPAIEARLGRLPPIAVMQQEHQEIERLIREVRHATDADAPRAVAALLERTRAHFAKEEEILFPLIASSLAAAELDALGDQWARRRGVVTS